MASRLLTSFHAHFGSFQVLRDPRALGIRRSEVARGERNNLFSLGLTRID